MKKCVSFFFFPEEISANLKSSKFKIYFRILIFRNSKDNKK